jgi:sugar phosphate isomerase/epimerase
MGAWAWIRGGHAAAPIPLPEVVRQLRDLGCDGVELAAWPPHLGPADLASPARRKALRARLEDHGLAVPALVGDFAAVPPALAAPADYVAAVEGHLDFCHDLGIPHLRVDTVSPSPDPPGGLDRRAAADRIARTWGAAARAAERAGVRLVWEFESAVFLNRPSEIRHLARAVDHPGFGVVFDVFHAFTAAVLAARQPEPPETLAGGVAELARLLAGHIGAVHLSDAARGPGGPPGVPGFRPPFGAGEVDLDQAVRAVRAAGYAGAWWTIDLGALCLDAPAAAPPAKRFVDALLARHAGP